MIGGACVLPCDVAVAAAPVKPATCDAQADRAHFNRQII